MLKRGPMSLNHFKIDVAFKITFGLKFNSDLSHI